MAHVHRFRDVAGLWSGSGETVYLSADSAEALAKALLKIAASIRSQPFHKSAGLTASIPEMGPNDSRGGLHRCEGCGRLEPDCSADPCEAVKANREA